MIWKRIFSEHEEQVLIDEATEVPDEREERHESTVASGVKGLLRDESEPDLRPLAIVATMTVTSEDQIGRTALLLAATTSGDAEAELKRSLASIGWRAVATEVGGLVGELPAKITRALVGASLNANVVEKQQCEMHALMHAAHEALQGFLPAGLLEASVGAKIAIVRNTKWISVAIMGDTAYHAVAHHERCGLGVMHL